MIKTTRTTLSTAYRIAAGISCIAGAAIILFGWVPPGLTGQSRSVITLTGVILLLWSWVLDLRADVSDLKRASVGVRFVPPTPDNKLLDNAQKEER